jgi:hypothetical protein
MWSPKVLRSSINHQIPHSETHHLPALAPHSYPTIFDSQANNSTSTPPSPPILSTVPKTSKQLLSLPRHALPNPQECLPENTNLSNPSESHSMGLSSPDTGSVTVKQVKFIQTHQQHPTHPLPSRTKNDKTSSPTATATAVPKLMIRLPTTSTRSRFSPTPQLPIPTINIIDSPVSECGSDPYKSQQGRDSGESEVELVADIHPGPLAVDRGWKQRGVSTTTGESDDEDDTDAPPAQKRKVVVIPMNKLQCDECIQAKLQECDHRCTVCQQREIRCVLPPFSLRFTICMPY